MAVSFFGLFLAGMFTLENQVAEDYLWRKPIIGSIFASICVLGAFATLYPRRCSRAFHLRGNSVYPIGNGSTAHRIPYVVRGHHYDCPNYSSHVIKIGGYTLCASCTGLLLGALLVLPTTMTYFLGYWRIEGGTVMVYLGIVGVSLGLLQFPLLKDRSSSLRLLFNLIFVLGISLIFIGIDASVHDLASDLFIILLITFWIYTRISLSEWDHRGICRDCGIKSCELASPPNRS